MIKMVTNSFKRQALHIINRFFIAITLSLIIANNTYGKPIIDLSKLYEPSTQWMGISWDKWNIDNDSTLIFCGHIDPSSKVITQLREHTASMNNDYRLSAENKFNDFGAEIDMSDINPLGIDLLDSDHYLWDLLKANIVAGASNIMKTYKLDKPLLDNGFCIKIVVDGQSLGLVNPITITTSDKDFKDALKILAYRRGLDINIEKVLREKYNILRGVRLNKQILPVNFSSGVNLTDIEIIDNHLIYNCEVMDCVREEFEESNNILAMHGRIACLIEDTAEDARSIKGFPLLGFKITYNWYSEQTDESPKELLSTVTYQFPSADMLDCYPKSKIFTEFIGYDYSYGYTEEDTDQSTPITISKSPVDLGLSVMWHSCNFNADSPEETGDLLGWGDRVLNLSLQPEEHNGYNAPDIISGNENYDPYYDKNYYYGRMPTEDEWRELVTKCIQIETKYQGVEGFKFIGPSGSAIFIPITPIKIGEKIYQTSSGIYWIGNRKESNRSLGNAIFLSEFNMIDIFPITRSLPIRGVH